MKQTEKDTKDLGDKLQNIGDNMNKAGGKAMGAGFAILIIILIVLYFAGYF